jgi:hypothetical protein
MTHGGEYIHVMNIPPAVVTTEWAADTNGPMDFGVVIMNPATATAILKGARGQTYFPHMQACHVIVGLVEHEHISPDPIADTPETCATHAVLDGRLGMWHPDLLVISVNVK